MHYEIAIIGCGPAALAFMNALPIDLPVLVLEQHSPDYSKLCGGLLTKQAQTETLRQFGQIPASLISNPAQAQNRFVDFNTGIKSYWPNEYLNVDRSAYDKWLLECVLNRYRAEQIVSDDAVSESEPHTVECDGVLQAGRLRILYGHRFVGFEGNETGLLRIESISNGNRYEFFAHLLIDASGGKLQTHPRKVHRLYALQAQARIDPKPETYVTIFDNEFSPFFGWIIPKQNDCLIGIGFELGFLPEHPKLAFYRFIDKLRQRLGVEIEISGVRASWLTQTRQPYDIDGGQTPVLRIGEAAGMISASSGEGLSYALSSGRLLGQALGSSIQQGRLYKRKPLVFPYNDYHLQVDELRFNISKSKLMSNVWQRRIAEWGVVLQNKFRKHL